MSKGAMNKSSVSEFLPLGLCWTEASYAKAWTLDVLPACPNYTHIVL